MNITNGGLIISAMWIASGLATVGDYDAGALLFITIIVNIVWLGVVMYKNRHRS